MAVRNHFHNAKAGVESPVTKKLSGIRLLFADLKFMRELIISCNSTGYICAFCLQNRIFILQICISLTKRDSRFTNMHLAYKVWLFVLQTGLSACNSSSVTCMLTPEKNNVNKFLSFIDKNLLTLVIVLCVM